MPELTIIAANSSWKLIIWRTKTTLLKIDNTVKPIAICNEDADYDVMLNNHVSATKNRKFGEAIAPSACGYSWRLTQAPATPSALAP
jgi:hypothetical protein